MVLQEALHGFYIQNKLEEEGGVNNDWFYLHFKLFSIKFPNSEFRKNVIHIHDIQHILYDCDTTWKGESFIAGWEIATGIWKHFPIGFMSLWAMGFSLFTYPKQVLKGYKAGLLVKGIIDLKIPKKKILQYNIDDLKLLITKEKPTKFNWLIYILWVLISEFIFLFPFSLLLILLLLFL